MRVQNAIVVVSNAKWRLLSFLDGASGQSACEEAHQDIGHQT